MASAKGFESLAKTKRMVADWSSRVSEACKVLLQQNATRKTHKYRKAEILLHIPIGHKYRSVCADMGEGIVTELS